MLGQSQATTGVVEGAVVDGDGKSLAGATVLLRNVGTNLKRSYVADDEGRFLAPLLPTGDYEIAAELTGYVPETRAIRVSVGASVIVSIVMWPTGEVIEVSGKASALDRRAGVSTSFDSDAVAGLPNNGRNFLGLMTLTPGVTIVQGPDGDEISVNGQRGIHNNVMVDGADFNNPFFGEQRGGQRPAFTFNLDAVEQVVVVANGANAEFGRSSSGFVTVLTKSGTNDFAGTAHLFGKDDALSARGQKADGSTDPNFAFDQEQVGFTLGGPIVKDKAFFFTSLDVQRGRSTKQTDPSRIEQRVVDALAALGSPDENGSITRTDDARVYLAKVDWHVNGDNLLTLRYNYTWSEQKNGTFDVDSWGRSANAVEKDSSHALTGTLLSTLAPSWYNEFRFQLAREDRPRSYDGPSLNGEDRPLPDTAFDFERSYRFGMPFFIPVDYDDTRIQLNDNISVVRGRHLVKAGVEYNRTNISQIFRGFANGRYIFSSTDGFLNFVRNPSYVECSDGSSSESGTCPAGTDIVGPVLTYLQAAGVGGRTAEEAGTQSMTVHETAAFIQDTWQVHPRVRLDYGLRWEAQIQPDPITPPDKVFYANFIGQTRNGQEFPSDGTIPSDYGMVQPRLAVAVDALGDSTTVIRGTGGIYYSRVPGLVLASSRTNNGSIGQTLSRSSALMNVLGPVPAYGKLIPQSETGDPVRPDVTAFDKHFRNPRTAAFSLAVERVLEAGLSTSITFNYAKTDFLTRFANRNDPVLGSPWSTGLGADGTNGINTLTVVESTARSKYWGVTLGLRKELSHHLAFELNYTYSKDRSDDDNERDPFSFRYAKITDLNAEWGLSDRDQTHRLNGWLLAQLPGGVDLNARYSYRSPQPKSIDFNGPGCAKGCDALTPQDRINPDGSVTQRNLGRKDNAFSSLDVRLSREFHTGQFIVEPVLEAFNLFNSRNLRRPEVTNLVFNFDGTVQSGAGDPLQVQLGVRARF
ncbi:MAG TPA: carboxypeptidase regulatory-like domain-containing protein [Kofleriaceae bacterium]|nr:carboxypeptidase regulatory-like domain-containing protein [Kofleriaceae bacterium]